MDVPLSLGLAVQASPRLVYLLFLAPLTITFM